MTRRFARAVKRSAFRRAGGRCQTCGDLFPAGGGGVQYDHIIPWAISRDSSLENCQILCVRCHLGKTGKKDAGDIAKVVRLDDRRMGIKPPGRKMPAGRDSNVSKTINRGVVERRSQAERHRDMIASRYTFVEETPNVD